MGSYAALRIAGLYFGGTKNDIDATLMTLFRASDKVAYESEPFSDETRKYLIEDAVDEGSTATVVKYKCPVSFARDRLELQGFTLETACRCFEIAVTREIESLTRWIAGPNVSEQFAEGLAEQLSVLQTFTPSVWIDGLRTIRCEGLRQSHYRDAKLAALPPVLRYMLGSHGSEHYRCPTSDLRTMLRLAVEAFGDGDELEYDLTDLVAGGYYEESSDLVAHAEYLLSSEFDRSQRIIVLTEGSTDKWILERSIAVLQPQLTDYFSFMDFEGARVAGGAGALANITKAFIGAGILNRVIALFDNDTAARVAVKGLTSVARPSNIVIAHYPHLDLLSSYPTIGPTGIVTTDVNSVGASIELYLGVDVLKDDDGNLMPVQWKGYEPSLKCYHAEVLDKSTLHSRFDEKIRRCLADPGEIDSLDWRGVRSIIKVLSTAFHDVDAEELVAFEEGLL